MFWRPLEGGAVLCELCYRRCEIQKGERGWCKVRANEGGRLVLLADGVLSRVLLDMAGYANNPFQFYRCGTKALFIGGVGCTAGCSFCLSGLHSSNPDAVPWLPGHEHTPAPIAHIWDGQRARYRPGDVWKNAIAAKARMVIFGENEPMLSYEFTLEAARQARAAGLDVAIETNGLSSHRAIEQIAKYVNAVYIGLKGSADSAFYADYARSPDAIPHVLESVKAWKRAGVHVSLGDVIPPVAMQSDAAAKEAQARLYGWIAREIGTHAPLFIAPAMRWGGPYGGLMAETLDDVIEVGRRILDAQAAARAAGLSYSRISNDDPAVCHNCGKPILRLISPMRTCRPCTMTTSYCPWWKHTAGTDAYGRCWNCFAETPVVAAWPD